MYFYLNCLNWQLFISSEASLHLSRYQLFLKCNWLPFRKLIYEVTHYLDLFFNKAMYSGTTSKDPIGKLPPIYPGRAARVFKWFITSVKIWNWLLDHKCWWVSLRWHLSTGSPVIHRELKDMVSGNGEKFRTFKIYCACEELTEL